MPIYVILAIWLVDRWITRMSCLSLCSGKWKKIKSKTVADNIFERITLSNFLKAKTDYPNIIKFEIAAVNTETAVTIVFTVSCFLGKFTDFFGIVWGLTVFLHYIIRLILFCLFVKK